MNPYDDSGKPTGKTVLEVLKSLHPEQAEANSDAFMDCEKIPALLQVDITAGHVERVIRKLSGGAGRLDSFQLQNLVLKYGAHSESLREAFASVIRRIANTDVEWEDIRALKAKRLIALDKCPGVRPVGIGEVFDRLFAKVMVLVTGDDIQEACGSDQLCSGLKAGIEGAIHAMKSLFDENCDTSWGLFFLMLPMLLFLKDTCHIMECMSFVEDVQNLFLILTRVLHF